MELHRGEIYYIEKGYQEEQGSEQKPCRPAIIVSNEKCNMHSSVVEVVYLTTQPKTFLPTHVDIKSSFKPSIALCEQICSVYVDRISSYIGKCTDTEMAMIDAALEISLGLKTSEQGTNEISAIKEAKAEEQDEQVKVLEQQIIKVTAERDMLASLYSTMVNSLVVGR